MKALLFVVLFLSVFESKSQQWSGNCLTDLSQVVPFDSFYFEGNSPSLGIIMVDTTFQGNVWQIGTVQKPGFTSALSGTNALQTDTMNAYPVGNQSAVVVYYDTNYSWIMNNNMTSLSFWHFYDTDTLADSCILQVTVDSGNTWLTLTESTHLLFPSTSYQGSLNNYGASFYPGTLWWSGRSSGWKQEAVCIVFPGIKGMTLTKSFGFRFLFTSDSTHSGKPGWMIDNIELSTHFSTPGVVDNQIPANIIKVYPNPTLDGRYTISYPSNYVSGTIEFFNAYGRKVKTLQLSNTIDISDLPKGIYHYSIVFRETDQRFTGRLQHL